jgi:hypothetical protein
MGPGKRGGSRDARHGQSGSGGGGGGGDRGRGGGRGGGRGAWGGRSSRGGGRWNGSSEAAARRDRGQWGTHGSRDAGGAGPEPDQGAAGAGGGRRLIPGFYYDAASDAYFAVRMLPARLAPAWPTRRRSSALTPSGARAQLPRDGCFVSQSSGTAHGVMPAASGERRTGPAHGGAPARPADASGTPAGCGGAGSGAARARPTLFALWSEPRSPRTATRAPRPRRGTWRHDRGGAGRAARERGQGDRWSLAARALGAGLRHQPLEPQAGGGNEAQGGDEWWRHAGHGVTAAAALVVTWGARGLRAHAASATGRGGARAGLGGFQSHVACAALRTDTPLVADYAGVLAVCQACALRLAY